MPEPEQPNIGRQLETAMYRYNTSSTINKNLSSDNNSNNSKSTGKNRIGSDFENEKAMNDSDYAAYRRSMGFDTKTK